MNDIKIKIKDLRKAREMSQAELAEALGVSRQAIIALERGESLPSLPLFCQMLEFFNQPIEQIIEIPYFEINQTNNVRGGSMRKDITNWSPMREISSLHDMIDRVFEEQFMPVAKQDSLLPAINVHETDGEYVLEMNLPGVHEEDLHIELDDDTITIRGERKQEKEEKAKNYLRKEIHEGTFMRQIGLPAQIDSETAEASLKDGVLKIALTKKEPSKPKVKRLEVKRK